MKKFLPFHMILFLALGTFPLPSQAVSTGQCVFAVVGEMLLPGFGYVALGHYDKALTFGLPRWYFSFEIGKAINHKDYQKTYDEVYSKSKDGKKIDIYLTKETAQASFYGSLSQSLFFTTVYDLVDTGCEENPETYWDLIAPLRFDKFGGNFSFWIPIGINVWGSQMPPHQDITYHLGEGLNKNELYNRSLIQHYFVGIGEELLFRGVIQRQFFYFLDENIGISTTTSRWSSIVFASLIFGSAHSGQGFSADFTQAFLFGMYLGWVAHPSNDTFNLTESIAIHSWWNMLTSYHLYNRAKEKKWDKSKPATKNLTVPLVHFTYRF